MTSLCGPTVIKSTLTDDVEMLWFSFILVWRGFLIYHKYLRLLSALFVSSLSFQSWISLFAFCHPIDHSLDQRLDDGSDRNKDQVD